MLFQSFLSSLYFPPPLLPRPSTLHLPPLWSLPCPISFSSQQEVMSLMSRYRERGRLTHFHGTALWRTCLSSQSSKESHVTLLSLWLSKQRLPLSRRVLASQFILTQSLCLSPRNRYCTLCWLCVCGLIMGWHCTERIVHMYNNIYLVDSCIIAEQSMPSEYSVCREQLHCSYTLMYMYIYIYTLT